MEALYRKIASFSANSAHPPSPQTPDPTQA